MTAEQKNTIDPKAFLYTYFKEIIAGVLFLFVYGPTFGWMWDRWNAASSYYSHGWLIPIVTIVLIYLQRDELVKIERKESGWGIVLIVIGLLIHLISAVLRIYFTSGFSMMFVIPGLILFFWGKETLSKIAFPVAFLVFMIPLPMVLITNISFKMKLFAAQIATYMLNDLGVRAIRSGSTIYMNTSSVVVDDVCSGLKYLISLTALGSIFAYWLKGSMLKRIFLFLCTLPIAIISNVARIILLALISEIWGTEYATGTIHDVLGFTVFVVAFVLLFFSSKVLE
ncbi:MAG: exosortase [Candidatus Omnitrophica bacterium]|nr:exosortase [Candidatus Omnitrophota bacterium]